MARPSPKKRRDEFAPSVKKTLAERVAYFCSNPECLKLTAGPHSDKTKSLTTGHAAHIHAAAPGGPRYDESQTPEERKSITNGIWMCRECGDIVDKDHAAYTAEQLRQWKLSHETMIDEVRTKGYAESLRLLRVEKHYPKAAKQVLALFEDRRALWVSFDAEFPDRVRESLTYMRRELTRIRGDVTDRSELDTVIGALTGTIRRFFENVEDIDLNTLRCDAGNPDWTRFRDALSALRKSVGMQVSNIASAYDLSLSDELRSSYRMSDNN